MFTDLNSSAAVLLDGGWSPEEREELIQEYELTAEEAEELCSEMERILEANKKNEYEQFFDSFGELPEGSQLQVLCAAASESVKPYGFCHLEDPDEYADNLEFDCPDMTEEIYSARSAEFLVVFDSGYTEKSVPCQTFEDAWTTIFDWPCCLIGKVFTLYDLYKICTENRSVVSLLKSVKPDFFDGIK